MAKVITPPTPRQLSEIRMDLVDKAKRLIEKGDVRWYDYCSSVGMIPGNVGHMRGMRQELAKYCWPEEWDGK